MYDVLNHFFTSAVFESAPTDERKAAISLFKKNNRAALGAEKAIYLLDRGFPSITPIRELETKNKYVIRVSKSFLKEVNEFRISEETDSVISIHFDKKRAHDAKLKNKIELPWDFSIRCVKIPLSNGETEILITNLSAEEAGMEELGGLYHLRWKIEISYNHLKNAVQVETFTGY